MRERVSSLLGWAADHQKPPFGKLVRASGFLRQTWPNTACTRTRAGFAALQGMVAPTADSASGGFVRQVRPRR